MATPDLSSVVSNILPSKSSLLSFSSSTLFWITIFIVILIFLAIGGIILWVVIRNLKFNKKIDIYEDRNGYVEWIGKDRARELVFNTYGDSVFFLLKRKRYLPRGEIKVGKNRYMYIIGTDGEWVNCGLESLNSKLSELNISPVHPDMRAFKSGMVKIMRDRFEKKPSWFKEYAPILIPVILFVIVGVSMYFIADRLVHFASVSGQVMDKAAEVLSKVNNVCSTSGIK